MPKQSPPLPPLDVLQRYSIEETCRYLRTSRETLYKSIRTGEVPIIKEGRRTYVSGRVIAARSSSSGGWTNVLTD